MYMRNTKCRAKIKVLNRTLKYQVSHTLNVLLFINLMRTLLQDSLNKSNNHYILLGQAPAKTPTFPMIYALNNKQVMPSGSWVIIPKQNTLNKATESKIDFGELDTKTIRK